MHNDTVRVLVTADLAPVDALNQPFVEGRGADYLQPVLPWMEEADLVVANLETALCEEDTPIVKCGPALHADPQMVPHLRELGFDVFTLGNNHTMDHGVEGLRRTIEALDAAGILHCGAAMDNEQASQPCVVDIKGRSLTILNFAEGEFCSCIDDGPGAARIEGYWSQRRVEQAKREYDHVLVVLHIGNEHVPVPSPVSTDLCHTMIAAGADAVISHHAHIPQPWTYVDGAPVCYALGNLLFGLPITDLKLDRTPGYQLGTVAMLEFGPGDVTIDVRPFRQQRDFKLAPLTADGRAAFDDYIGRAAKLMADLHTHRRTWEQEVRELMPVNPAEAPRELLSMLESDDPDVRRKGGAMWYARHHTLAHHEKMRQIGRLLLEGRFEETDEQTAQELAAIKQLVRRCIEPV